MTNEAHLRYHAFSWVDASFAALVLAAGNAAAIDWRRARFSIAKRGLAQASSLLKFSSSPPCLKTARLLAGDITLRNDPRVLPVGRVLERQNQ